MLFQIAFYINLDSRPDRKKHIEEQCERVGITAERVTAIPGGKKNIAISHLVALTKAALTNQNALILEDDCVFGRYFVQERFVLPYDWDMFYYGANHREPAKQITGNFGKCVKPLTAHSYVVKASSITKLCTEIINQIHTGKIIDEIYAEAIQAGRIVAYCAMPNLTWQLPNHSDAEGRFMDYSFMIPEREVEI